LSSEYMIKALFFFTVIMSECWRIEHRTWFTKWQQECCARHERYKGEAHESSETPFFRQIWCLGWEAPRLGLGLHYFTCKVLFSLLPYFACKVLCSLFPM
jgi:hypothetical protein